MGAVLAVGVLVRNPATGLVEFHGPDTGTTPDWVREVAPGEHLWVDDKTGEVAPEPAKRGRPVKVPISTVEDEG